jgi:hypothetical protein
MTGVSVRKKIKKRYTPRSSEEIRYEYITQLWAELERRQDEDDQEMTDFLTTAERDNAAQETYLAYADRKEFTNEMVDAGDCLMDANVFVFKMPKGYALTKRVLEFFEMPDVVWTSCVVHIGLGRPSINGGCFNEKQDEWRDHLVIEVILVDG